MAKPGRLRVDLAESVEKNEAGLNDRVHELAPHNVRVNCVHPTNVDTPLIQNDAVSSAFRPDLDRPPTRAEFAEAARGNGGYPTG